MNIYIHVEISVREFDSKLLLATLAAAKGHEVLVSDLEVIEKGLLGGWLPPGIFHTKSLTFSNTKHNRHKSLRSRGVKVTSIDEEAGITFNNYEQFSNERYSIETINESDAIFGWGDEDFSTLKKDYQNYSNKIYKTGSPRADLWKPLFLEYWNSFKLEHEKPYLLVSSNMTIGSSRSFENLIKDLNTAGLFDKIPELFKRQFIVRSDDYLKAIVFIEAIKYLSKHNSGYDIVFRPHPTEKVDTWKTFFKGVPNLHIIHEGSLTKWINKSFAVMHNGCSSALEASVMQKPVVTYVATELKNHFLNNNFANQLGHKAKSKEELLQIVNKLFNESKNNSNKNEHLKNLELLKKIYIDKDELAAEKIIKIWEKISHKNETNSINLTKLKFFILKMRINRFIGNILKNLLPSRFQKLGSKQNLKFKPINITTVKKDITKIQKILKIDKKIECKLISERTILIRSI